MANDLELIDVHKKFGDFVAVHGVSVAIPQGEFFSFLGPSGCGKTTILRMISGFIDPTSGAIKLAGRDLNGIGPNKRPTALIFQNLALFPLMSVADNIGYGLMVRGVSSAERRKVVERMLELIALRGYGDKRIDELSGGQKQRVAIARALAVEPKVLLLDEPLSALDLKLRQHMRQELRAIQRSTGVTFIYITHDQGEALAMSDRVAVMSQGRIEQVGPSAEVYNQPQTAFVASFVGENNAIAGKVAASEYGYAVLDTPFGRLRAANPRNVAAGEAALLFVRPERVRLAAPGANGADNVVESQVLDGVFEGPVANILLANEGQQRPITVSLSNDGNTPRVARGERRRITFSPDDAILLPPASRPVAEAMPAEARA
ncbi:MAG: ABC transporter ATP-binding protein [Alphaproteobacteria bacterium]|nr:ABC transporter ATP-binding protein [Alphaproteobacteria bacterium]